MTDRRRPRLAGIAPCLVPVLLTFGAGCAVPDAPGPPEASSAGSGAGGPATTGQVIGRVVLSGTPPPEEVLNLNTGTDPYCASVNGAEYVTERFVVSENQGLRNVLVHLEGDFARDDFVVPTEAVTLDQQSCRYVPHVLGVRVGQPLELVNSDETLHNIHGEPAVNRGFNLGQPPGVRTRQVFTVAEGVIPFSCDVHDWMRAYVGVFNHPYFDVSAEDGGFELREVPPGRYTLHAWHEVLGALRQPVTLEPGRPLDLTLAFDVEPAGD